VLGLLHGYAVDVVDLLADGIIAEAITAAGPREIVGSEVDARAGIAERGRNHCFRQARHMITRRRRRLVALSHHDPAYVLEHLAAVRLATGRAYEDDAGLAARIFLEPDDLRLGIESVAGMDRRENAAGGIAEIGNRVERDVRYGLAEHDVEDEEIIDRRAWIADRAREDIR
jgi:hypothetical protein